MNIGKNIRKYRINARLTQRELAEKINCAIGTIQQYELGKRQPRIEQLEKIANTLDIPLYKLLNIKPQNEEREIDIVEYKLLNILRNLNTQGKEKAIERLQELTEMNEMG